MAENLRRRAILAPHSFHVGSARDLPPEAVTNLVHRANGDDDLWIEEATGRIGDWRSLARSVYLRWAITINACDLAERRYETMADTGLTTQTLRVVQGAPELVPLAIWPGPEAARHYETTKLLVAAYGVSDLYGAIEDILFDLAEIVYRQHPGELMQGGEPAMRKLRRLWHHRVDGDAAASAWRDAWSNRFDEWRRAAVFRGLPRLLRNVFRTADLRRPTGYRTDVDSWASTLEMIASLRHHVVHGAPTVSKDLADLSNQPANLTFDFVEGAPLDVKLHHLQSVELFVDQLLNALNLSLLEKAMGPLLPGAHGSHGRGP